MRTSRSPVTLTRSSLLGYRNTMSYVCDHGRAGGYWGGCGACSPPADEVELLEEAEGLARTIYSETVLESSAVQMKRMTTALARAKWEGRNGVTGESKFVVCYLIINGQTLNSWRHEVSYEEIVKLAGMSGTPTMTCSQTGKDGFTMTPGMVVRTGREMIFNVAHTGSA